MRFTGPEHQRQAAAAGTDDGSGFFITEDVRPDQGMHPMDGVEQIQEEKSYGSETMEDRQVSQQQFAPVEDMHQRSH